MAPTQFPPDVLLARMLLATVSMLPLRIAPPPRPPALLPEKVLLVTVAVSALLMPPPPFEPLPEAVLPEKGLLVTARRAGEPPSPLAPATPTLLTVLAEVTVRRRLAMAPPPPPGAVVTLSENVQLVTVAVPKLKMAPPKLRVLLPEKVQLVTVSVPPFWMAPPLLAPAAALAMVRFWTVNVMPTVTENTPTVPPPLMVITLPPSMVVSALMVFVLVTIIVAAPPQSKVTVPSKRPPPGRQAFSAVSVQLALVPVPTTHARADEVAANTAKTSKGRTSTSRVRTVVAFIACLPC